MGWLIALGILAALALLPIGVSVRYNEDGFSLRCLLGWIPISLTKKGSGKTKPKKQGKKKPKKKTSEPEKEKKGGSITDFLPLVQTGAALLNALRKKVRVRRLEMKLILAADDPCDLAINYGRAWAAVGNLMPQLERVFVIRKRDVEVECDFESSETAVKARVDAVIRFGAVVWIAVYYGLRALKQLFVILKSRKGGAPNE